MMLLEEFVGQRNAIKDVVADLAPLLREAELKAELDEVNEHIARLDSCRFNVLVMGQLKRGKSTLVNVLLRKPDMLPSGVIPVSSAVVTIQHGDPERAEVGFKDGRRETGAIDAIQQYCVEKNNPQNEKQVSSIDIHIPHPWLEDGIHIVDTPGAGSVESYHTEISYQHIPQADVILFLLTADMPIGEGERQFLLEIAKHNKRNVIFVINKSDRLTPEEVEEVRDYNASIIRGVKGFESIGSDDFYLVSARLAMDALEKGFEPQEKSGFPLLEARMVRFLREDRTAIIIRNSARQILSGVGRLRQTFEIESHLTSMGLAEIETRIQECKDKKEKFAKEHRGHREAIQDAVGRAKGKIKKKCELNIKTEVKNAWTQKLDTSGVWQKLQPAALANNLNEYMLDEVTQRVGALLEDVYEDNLKKVLSSIEKGIEAELQELQDFGAEFGVKLPDLSAFSIGNMAGGAAGLGMATGGAVWTSMLANPGFFAWAWSGLVGTSLTVALSNVLAPVLIAAGTVSTIGTIVRQYKNNVESIKAALTEATELTIQKCIEYLCEDLDAIENRSDVLLKRVTSLHLEPIEQALRMAEEEKRGIDHRAQERRAQMLAACDSMDSALRVFI